MNLGDFAVVSPSAESAFNSRMLHYKRVGPHNGKPHSWLMDSGASDPTTPDRSILFNPVKCSKYFDTSNGPVLATLKGSASLTFYDGTSTTIEDVYYLPQCKANLLSEAKLTKLQSDPSKQFHVWVSNGSRTLLYGTEQRVIRDQPRWHYHSPSHLCYQPRLPP